jgi:Zn-dependent protease
MTADAPQPEPGPLPDRDVAAPEGGAPPGVALPRPPSRPRGIKLGRIAQVPVYLNVSWLILAVVVIGWYGPIAAQRRPGVTSTGAYLIAAGFMLVLLVSVLLHELGHAVVARRYGIGVRSITLEMLGGYTEMETDSPNARADLLVSLAGPLVSAVLGGLALAVRLVVPSDGLLGEMISLLAVSNLLVAAFNVLPGLPLDGGRALRAAVWAITGDRNLGSRVAGWAGRLVAVLVASASFLLLNTGAITLFGAVFALLIALTMWQGAGAAVRYGRLANRLRRVNLRQLAQPLYTVPVGTPLAEASRRAAEAGHDGAALAVSDSSGRLVALVNDQAAGAVPVERRPWVAVESVARTLDPAGRLPADLAGEEVMRAVQANPAPVYLVVSGDDVVGVLRVADLARLLNS